MAELVVDVPETTVLVRKEYMHNFSRGVGEYEPALWIAVTSIQARAIMPQVLTNRGVFRQHLPITALTTKPHPAHIPLEFAQLWNCFSYNVVAHRLKYMTGLNCEVLLKDKSTHKGTYLFTLDWYGNNLSEMPGEGGHKSANIIELNCGCIVAQPDNRCLWREASFITKPFTWQTAYEEGYTTNQQAWTVERSTDKWVTEDSDQFFYKDVEVR